MNKLNLIAISLPLVALIVWFLVPESIVLASGFLDVTITSPLRAEAGTAEGLIMVLLNTLITIAIPIVVLMIIYAGFMYVTARGNAEQVKKATTALTYAIIGAILIIGAVAITGIMEQTVAEFRS